MLCLTGCNELQNVSKAPVTVAAFGAYNLAATASELVDGMPAVDYAEIYQDANGNYLIFLSSRKQLAVSSLRNVLTSGGQRTF
eukprot:3268450-Rhodomonas_salina.1